ncbi:MAG: hypothetical protein Tsb0021_15380 [Chlamydiales bacterium]
MEIHRSIIIGVGIPPHEDLLSSIFIKAEVVLMARNQGMQPLLYQLEQTNLRDQIASAGGHRTTVDHRGMVMIGQVSFIDKQKKHILIQDLNNPYHTTTVQYEHLIIASQGKSEREISHQQELTLGLQALVEALKIRHHLPSSLQQTETPNKDPKALLNKLLIKAKTLQETPIDEFALRQLQHEPLIKHVAFDKHFIEVQL